MHYCNLFSTYDFPGNLVFNTASIHSMTSDSWWGSRFCKGKQAHTYGICHNRSTRLHFSEVSPCRMLSSLSASLSASNGVVQALRCECLTVWVWVWTRGRFQIRSSFLNTRGGGRCPFFSCLHLLPLKITNVVADKPLSVPFTTGRRECLTCLCSLY